MIFDDNGNLVLPRDIVKYILISLTDKGKAFAESLKETEKRLNDYTLPPNYEAQFKNLSAMTHLNVLDDHIAIHEINYNGKGDDRVVFVYVKLNGNNILRLWCEVHQTYECVHTKYAWSLPDVQASQINLFENQNKNKYQNHNDLDHKDRWQRSYA